MDNDEILKRPRQKATEGRATEMTSEELDAFREWSKQKSELHTDQIQRRQEIERRQFSQIERDVFSFIRREFNKIQAVRDYDPDKDDDEVLSKAAQRFNLSKEEAKR